MGHTNLPLFDLWAMPQFDETEKYNCMWHYLYLQNISKCYPPGFIFKARNKRSLIIIYGSFVFLPILNFICEIRNDWASHRWSLVIKNLPLDRRCREDIGLKSLGLGGFHPGRKVWQPLQCSTWIPGRSWRLYR